MWLQQARYDAEECRSFAAKREAGDREGADIVQRAYNRWMKRPDRKTFDRDGGEIPVFSDNIIMEWAALNPCA